MVGHPSKDSASIKIPYVVDILLHQPALPSFCIGLVKTESDYIVRSGETDLGRWMLVVAVIGVDAYLEDTVIGVFWLHAFAR